ncbi:uncharacterized protein MYCFIDRAFT_204777 [Pseudocercospora fijiensis CIRAD86]|uniref:Acyltransferase 3 domain-containing protein n=1 Tax=Pseudocercospora fijiensis (strain CIRAD86) TaxID=383855 RepID=M2ZJP4_PSEFD|nr:uncharacterized protein MYCFIDRAFT_204777 [Pseudocercospora fijiensis CIRAD86]EME79314.1 hypothetical protein MYCFIDRAFT_204777 [Pseudocercospora fijiensis CIRAD86]
MSSLPVSSARHGNMTKSWYLVRALFSTSQPTTSNQAASPTKTSRTASFDGLRGLACLIVFNFHFLYPYTQTTIHGYAVELEHGASRYLHQLPILCLIVRGRAMVTLFFAISGYVLSHGFLAATRTDRLDHGVARLASLALRRWMRLYLPASISMLMVMCAAYFGAFEKGRKLNNTKLMKGVWEQHPPIFKTFGAQVWNFGKMWWGWQTPFKTTIFYNPYDPHTWTIPVEFRSSMVLFMLLLASMRLRQRWRLGFITFVTLYMFAARRWDVATFTGGALVADLHLCHTIKNTTLLEEKESLLPTEDHPASIPEPPPKARRYALMAWRYFPLVVAFYVLSFPDEQGKKTPGFIFLHNLIKLLYNDTFKFWHSAAAIVVLWCVPRLSPIKAFLGSSIPQYLGKISYGLYLVHGPLLHSIGFALQPKIWELTGFGSKSGYCGGLMLGWICMLTISIGGGHLFWKYIDMPLVRFAKYVEQTASASTPQQRRRTILE